MAKKSKIAANEQRKVIVARYATKRLELKKALVSPTSTDEEREAEVIASLLVRRMAQDDGVSPSTPGPLGRLSHSLEHSRRDADG